jgi:hypothetical protein
MLYTFYIAEGTQMDSEFINLELENLEKEHLCCAIADKKHQCGVATKKA